MKFRRVRTLYACLAENDGELSFEPNQIITNGTYYAIQNKKNNHLIKIYIFLKKKSVRSSNEPGWLDGTLNGKSGLIPENYVEVLP